MRLVILANVLNVIDIATTLYGMSLGLQEANELVRSMSPMEYVVVKITSMLILSLVYVLSPRESVLSAVRFIARFLLICVTALLAVVVCWNIAMII